METFVLRFKLREPVAETFVFEFKVRESVHNLPFEDGTMLAAVRTASYGVMV